MRNRSPLYWVIILFLAGQFFFYLNLAFNLEVDYWDGYDYLNNAKIIVGLSNYTYGDIRPPLISLINGIVFLLGHYLGFPPSLISSHLIAICISYLFLIILYSLFRRFFSPELSILGIFLVAINRMFIHYVPFAMIDLPGLLCLTLSLYLYYRARENNSLRLYCLLGISIALTGLTNFTQGGILFPLIILLELIYALNSPQDRFYRLWIAIKNPTLWLVMLGALSIIIGVEGFVLKRVFNCSFVRALLIFKGVVIGQYRVNVVGVVKEPVTEYFEAYLAACSWPIVALIIIGIGYSLWQREERDLFFLSWFFLFAGIQSLWIEHKESRYSFTLIPPAYYFVVRIMEVSYQGLKKKYPAERSGKIFIFTGIILFSFILYPLSRGLSELMSFSDPAYHTPLQRDVSNYIAKITPPENNIYWAGGIYTIYPSKYIFIPGDEFFYFFDMQRHVISFYINREPKRVSWERYPPIRGVPYLKNILTKVKEGDTIILPPIDAHPPFPSSDDPLYVQQVKVQRFKKTLGEDFIFIDQRRGKRLIGYPRNQGMSLKLDKDYGVCEVYIRNKGTDRLLPVGLFDTRGSRELKIDGISFSELEEIAIINYSVKSFTYHAR